MSQIPRPSGGASRLTQMQAQFQQKQMQEKEQKLLQMLDSQQQKAMQKAALNGVIPPSNKYNGNNLQNMNNNINNSVGNLGAGKVRQMFEERRRTGGTLSSNSNGYGGRSTATGVDKSHPLEPLVVSNQTKARSLSSKSDPSSYATAPGTRNTQAPPIMKPSNLGSHNRTTSLPREKSRDSPTPTAAAPSAKPYVQRQQSKSTASHPPPPPSTDSPPADDFFVPQTTKYSDYAQELEKRESSLANKLARTRITSPPPDNSRTKSPVPKPSRSPTKSPSNTSHRTVTLSPAPRPPVSSTKSIRSTTSKVGGKKKPPPRSSAGPPPGLNECKICGRYFAPDRIEKHEQICKKASTKKRKVFDPTKMRMQGTEAEPYIRVVSAKPAKPAAAPSADKSKKADWRKKHEEFIATIRAAKEYQAYVAKGGDPKDLPPPPPSDNSDYIQCPYCNRKFSQGAAERHIPKCKNIKSNKR